MKNLLTLIAMALIVFNTSAHAQSANLEEELFNYNQIGKINAAMLDQVDQQIRTTKIKFQGAAADADAGDDIVEGKILASMIIMIEDELDKVDEKRALLDDKYEIVDADINSIQKDLNGINVLIDEMNP